MRTRVLALALLIALFSPSAGRAGDARRDIDPEKRRMITELIAVTGAVKLGDQVIDTMMAQIRQADPKIPDAFYDAFKKKMNVADVMPLVIPVYDKYYSKEDIRGLLAFYKSPLGQKVIASTPKVMAECQKIGADWGRDKAEEVLRDLGAQQPNPKQ